MIKILLNNPFSDSLFGVTPRSYFRGIKNFPKYQYLIEELLKKQENVSLSIFVHSYKNSRLHYFAKVLSIYVWCYINQFPVKKFNIVTNKKYVESHDIFFSFSTGLRQNNSCDHYRFLRDMSIIKIVHLSHFMHFTDELAQITKLIGVNLFVAESNLSKHSDYFRKYFPFYKKDVCILPFVPKSRFFSQIPFEERVPKCLAVGSLSIFESSDLKRKNFYDFFRLNTFHPMRKTLFKNRMKLKQIIDCHIEQVYEGGRRLPVTRHGYYNQDIVELFNKYKMFVYPEEAQGLPALGFIEGMACGSVFIGLDSPMYADIGMKEGLHYIAYDGTLDNLTEKIQAYQGNPIALSRISENGKSFAATFCNPKTVTNRFLIEIIRLCNIKK
jgi:hypothetical protein